MKRHKLEQQPENFVYYTYSLFGPFSSQITCVTSTRLGGVSQGPLHSLNVSSRVNDDEQNVMTNRLRIFGVMDIDPTTVAQAQLVHNNHIQIVTEQSATGFTHKFGETDGLVTNVVNRPLFIPVADCAAVAFFDPLQRVIGLLHAGWKGIVRNIVPAIITIIHTTYGSNPSDILVGVSLCLGPCCYEVREDFIHTMAKVQKTGPAQLCRRQGS
jgi:YfiH family protein